MTGNLKKVHLIAIGGSVMHSLAIELKKKGLNITGSDDAFYNPSKSTLESNGLLPEKEGWFPEKITTDLDAVVLGMHAKADNPELLKAQELNIPIYSFPEFIYLQSEHKQRIVIAGSHGKTSITAMIIHVLNTLGKKCDYVVGAKVKSLESGIKLTDAPIIIIEGDEYLSSALDSKPKFLNYQHHIVVINGISWDHKNVFPTYSDYIKQFELLSEATPKAGSILYNDEDPQVKRIAEANDGDNLKFPYTTPKYKIIDGITTIVDDRKRYPLSVFGQHNLINIAAAKMVCERIAVNSEDFLKAIRDFKGAGNRLELISEKNGKKVFRDFAHAPSKLEATAESVKTQFADSPVLGVYELHTFSSLQADFIGEYNGTFKATDKAIIYLDPETLAKKGSAEITPEFIKKSFNRQDLQVIQDKNELTKILESHKSTHHILLMSSGNFGGMDLNTIFSK